MFSQNSHLKQLSSSFPELICVYYHVAINVCVSLPGPAVRDSAEGGGPQTRLPVFAGQPSGHVQLPAAP